MSERRWPSRRAVPTPSNVRSASQTPLRRGSRCPTEAPQCPSPSTALGRLALPQWWNVLKQVSAGRRRLLQPADRCGKRRSAAVRSRPGYLRTSGDRTMSDVTRCQDRVPPTRGQRVTGMRHPGWREATYPSGIPSGGGTDHPPSLPGQRLRDAFASASTAATARRPARWRVPAPPAAESATARTDPARRRSRARA